jgi:hypothetical protein
MVWHPTELSIADVGDTAAVQVKGTDGAVTLVTIAPNRD